jgi:hypothetical protein
MSIGAREAAVALGRSARTPETLSDEVRRWVQKGHTNLCLDLLGVHAALSTSPDRLLEYLRREVVRNPLRGLFFVQAPLDRALETVAREDLAVLVLLALDMGADLPRLAREAMPRLVQGNAEEDPTLRLALARLASCG